MKKQQNITILGLAAILFVFGTTLGNTPLSAKELATYFGKNDPSSTKTVDHSAFATLLKTHVQKAPSGVNLVDYKALKKNQISLKTYLASIKNIKVRDLNPSEQFAYWANLYNALTLDVVIDAYPVKTIRDIDISPGLLSNGPWGKRLIAIEGKKLSLNDIEHNILRPIYKDPRVHYAVNCASISCPNLLLEPFAGKTLESQLDKAAKDYINNPRGVDTSGKRLNISKIYSWYKKDFGGKDKSLLAHLAKYADPSLKEVLMRPNQRIDYNYDWNLNDKK